MAIFVALVVVCLAQITWWVVFQVTISREQLAWVTAQAEESAQVTSQLLNRHYGQLAAAVEIVIRGGDLQTVHTSCESLREDPVLVGYSLRDSTGALLAVSGDTSSSLVSNMSGRVNAVLYLSEDYPSQFLKETRASLVFHRQDRPQSSSPWFDPSMFSLDPKVADEIAVRERHRIIMFLAEGSFFILLTVIGAYLIYRSLLQSEELKQRQENFIHAITHELKVPLASIRLYLETMASGRVDKTRCTELVPRMLDDCSRLEQLVDNVLEAGRFRDHRHHYRLESANISIDLEEYLDALKPSLERHNVRVTTSIEPEIRIRSDYRAMQRVVNALIDNAIKYSPPERRELRLSLRKVGRNCEINFRDKGIGIPKVEQEKVFERFYRPGSESTRSVKGTGLGLFLVREIVGAHQGTVKLSSEGRDKGTTISIILPLENKL